MNRLEKIFTITKEELVESDIRQPYDVERVYHILKKKGALTNDLSESLGIYKLIGECHTDMDFDSLTFRVRQTLDDMPGKIVDKLIADGWVRTRGSLST